MAELQVPRLTGAVRSPGVWGDSHCGVVGGLLAVLGWTGLSLSADGLAVGTARRKPCRSKRERASAALLVTPGICLAESTKPERAHI